MYEMTMEAAIIAANRLLTEERMDIDREEMKAAIRKLIDAARYRNPMKPVEGYKCPNCGLQFLRTFKYCMMCGQALDWSSL